MARFNNGWVKLHRKLFEGEIPSNPYLLSLWVWLLGNAHWAPSTILWKGKRREIPAGTVVMGISEVALLFSVSRRTVHKWLHHLHNTGRIVLESSTRGSVVTICNWDIYQSNEDDEGTPSKHQVNTEGTPSKHQVALIEEVKKGRIEERKKGESGSDAVTQHKSAPALPRLGQIWNAHRGTLPELKACGSTRRRHADARWRDHPDESYWIDIVTRLAGSPFCRGENQRGWRADFDFLIRPETQHKVLEGKYDQDSKGPGDFDWDKVFGRSTA